MLAVALLAQLKHHGLFVSTVVAMPVSKIGAATRAFVATMLAMARCYQLLLQVNRDSPPEDLLKAYKRVLLKCHPDKGGSNDHTQRLQAAKETWQQARDNGHRKGGRPSTRSNHDMVAAKSRRAEYRVNALVVLLTYQGVADLKQWHRFIAFVRRSLKMWGVQRWGATLEACETDGLHTHLVLQFTKLVDKTARSFTFEALTPNVRKGDYLGEGINRKRHQLSVDRGFFYVFADKVGTQREVDGRPCFEGNHVPVWVTAHKGQSRYAVLGKWCENLWKERKLGHETYEEYLYLTRDGVLSRKRNLNEVMAWEERRAYYSSEPGGRNVNTRASVRGWITKGIENYSADGVKKSLEAMCGGVRGWHTIAIDNYSADLVRFVSGSQKNQNLVRRSGGYRGRLTKVIFSQSAHRVGAPA